MTAKTATTEPKPLGRPSLGPRTQLGLRLTPTELAALDEWVNRQDGAISRAEAVRRLVLGALALSGDLRT